MLLVFTMTGSLALASGADYGNSVAGFVGDSTARLIDDDASATSHEDYYYDGVRRIQDTSTLYGSEGGPPSESLVSPALDRDYIYGVGDHNEFIAQIDSTGGIYYMLQDANLNVVALATSTGAVRQQYVYTPYGECLVAETVTGSVLVGNRVGFQGMFIDVQNGFQANRNVIPGPVRHYLTANRVYDPPTGRWLQRDPNETAQPIVEALVFNANALGALLPGFDREGHYSDGTNHYLAFKSNPVRLRDALGLVSFDYFAEGDEIIAGISADRFAAAASISGTISTGLNFASLLGGFAVTLLPGYDVVALGAKLALGNVTFEDIVAAGLSVGGAAILFKFGGKALGAILRYADEALQGARNSPKIPAVAREVLDFVRSHRGAPPPGYKGGKEFLDKQGQLPPGSYREYDIDVHVSGVHRGTQRIVVDSVSGQAYYTPDHYATFVPFGP